MKVRFVFCLFILLFICLFTSQAQDSRFKSERRVYLWDVTLSMKGYNGAPNIWSDVVEALAKDINSIDDEDTEIVILPFQTSVLEVWTQKATSGGKKELISKIRQYKNDQVTNTNICLPFNTVIKQHLADDKRNLLILLTDGNHNTDGYLSDGSPNINCLLDLISNWCDVAFQKDAYAFYVMLTKYAKNEELVQKIKESCRITTVDGTMINFLEILFQDKYAFNIKDDKDKPIILSFSPRKNIEVPSDIKININSEFNDFIEVNETSILKDNMIGFSVKLKKPYEELKNTLPQDENKKVTLNLSLTSETQSKHPLVLLLSEEIELSLINKPEKTLRIYVE